MQNITTIGADPEVFLRNAAGRMISSVHRIGGSKNFPRPIDAEGNAIQEDNVTVEFNTPPCRTLEDFRKHLQFNLNYIAEFVKEQDLEICIQPSAVFDDEQLNTEEAQTFGCEPDFNAWREGRRNPRPKADNPNLRSAGGHIHIGLDDGIDHIEVIKWMDVYVGCQLIRYDGDTQRRELYGKPGAFRRKSYGVEYRTPSNVWIKNDELIKFVWDQTDKAIAAVKAGRTINDRQALLIQQCILTSDVAMLDQIEAELGA